MIDAFHRAGERSPDRQAEANFIVATINLDLRYDTPTRYPSIALGSPLNHSHSTQDRIGLLLLESSVIGVAEADLFQCGLRLRRVTRRTC